MTSSLDQSGDRPRGFIGRLSMMELGLYVLMASMTMLFSASLLAYVFTRLENPVWRTASMPELPRGLLLSSATIASVSFCMSRAVRSARANRLEGMERWLWGALISAAVFLVVQAHNWRVMMTGVAHVQTHTLYAFTFYMLTGLHAAHVFGGFVPLGIVLRKAKTRQYSSSRFEGVRLCRRYWDYLGIVWVVLLTTLYALT